MTDQEVVKLTRYEQVPMYAYALIKTQSEHARRRWEYVVVQARDNGVCGLPGGAVRPGEHPWNAVCREVKEELGLWLPQAIAASSNDNRERKAAEKEAVEPVPQQRRSWPKASIWRRIVKGRWSEESVCVFYLVQLPPRFTPRQILHQAADAKHLLTETMGVSFLPLSPEWAEGKAYRANSVGKSLRPTLWEYPHHIVVSDVLFPSASTRLARGLWRNHGRRSNPQSKLVP